MGSGNGCRGSGVLPGLAARLALAVPDAGRPCCRHRCGGHHRRLSLVPPHSPAVIAVVGEVDDV